jgi:acetyl esterase/lipase
MGRSTNPALDKRIADARLALAMNQVAASAIVEISSRRLRGAAQPGWSLPFEGVVGVMNQAVALGDRFDVVGMRRAMDAVAQSPLRRDVRVAPETAGGVPALWVRPSASTGRVVLYLHGGGYFSGSPRTHLGVISEIAAAAGADVLAPAYRLAPEDPFPAAVVDAWNCYWWLLARGVPPEQIVVAGDSAGGGLVVALLLAVRDSGIPLPAASALLSPWLDLTFSGPTVRTNAATDYLNEASMRRVAAMYLNGADPLSPLASPLFADLRGLPPLLIQVGTAEMLLDDAKRFARRASAAHVPVDLELWEGMVHVWHFMHAIEPNSRQALARIGRFVRDEAAASLPDAPQPEAKHGPKD